MADVEEPVQGAGSSAVGWPGGHEQFGHDYWIALGVVIAAFVGAWPSRRR